jgi:hypothetical protein
MEQSINSRSLENAKVGFDLFINEREWVVERAAGKFYSNPTRGGVFMKCQ